MATLVIKNKPNPVGIKSFIHCGKSSKAYNFELFQGAGTGISAEHTYLGLGRSTVMRLVKNIPRNKNFKVFFDKYSTSIAFLPELKACTVLVGCREIQSNGSRSFKAYVFNGERRKELHGQSSYKVREVVMVRWYDNSSVIVTSTF